MSLNALLFSYLDDDEFTAVIYEFRNGPVHFDPDRLSSLSINPLTSDFEQFLVRPDDLDPDIHFNIDGRCSSLVEDKFNDILQKETAISREQHSFFHLNIRSLQNKVDELSTLLSTLNIKFSVVGITKTWLQDTPLGVNTDGYNFVYKNLSVRSGGGVGLYLSENLDYRIRTDIYVDEDEVMESFVPMRETLLLG